MTIVGTYLWGANWAEILTGMGTVGVAFGLIFAAVQVRDSRMERSREIAEDLITKWDSKDMVLARAN